MGQLPNVLLEIQLPASVFRLFYSDSQLHKIFEIDNTYSLLKGKKIGILASLDQNDVKMDFH